MKSKKFILTLEEEKRLTSDIEGSIPNSVGLNSKEDTLNRGKEADIGIKFPERHLHLGPDRTIQC